MHNTDGDGMTGSGVGVDGLRLSNLGPGVSLLPLLLFLGILLIFLLLVLPGGGSTGCGASTAIVWISPSNNSFDPHTSHSTVAPPYKRQSLCTSSC